MLSLFTTILATLRRHDLLFLFLLTAALILLSRDRLARHDARLKLESTLAEQQKIVTDSDQRQSARDAQLTRTLSQIAALKKSVQTPQQSAVAINNAPSQLVAASSNGQPLLTPIEIDAQRGSGQQGSAQQGTSSPSKLMPPSTVLAHSDRDASATQQSPASPPATLRIPQNDSKPLFDTIEDCQICRSQPTNALTAQRAASLIIAHGTFWAQTQPQSGWRSAPPQDPSSPAPHQPAPHVTSKVPYDILC